MGDRCGQDVNNWEASLLNPVLGPSALLANPGSQTLQIRARKELRARAPDFACNRAASLKSKSSVGQAVLVLVLEGKPWGDLEAMFPLRKVPA